LLADQYNAGHPLVDDIRDDLQYIKLAQPSSLEQVVIAAAAAAVLVLLVVVHE
jgi:hypothetical protein